MAGAATPALATLVKAGVPHETCDSRSSATYRIPATSPRAQVFKTLIIALPQELAVAIVPIPSKLSLKAAAAALGAPKAAMAEPAAAERATGYVVGGISPFGQRKRHWDVAVAPPDLIRLTGAITWDLAAPA